MIRAQKEAQLRELFDVFVRELGQIVQFDALAKFDEGASNTIGADVFRYDFALFSAFALLFEKPFQQPSGFRNSGRRSINNSGIF